MEPICRKLGCGGHGLGVFIDQNAGAGSGFVDPIHQRVIQHSGLDVVVSPGFDPYDFPSIHQHREAGIFYGGGGDALMLQAAGEFAKKLIVHVDALLICVG